MSADPQRIWLARKTLEERFGLAMLGVTDLEIARSLAAADLAEGRGAEPVSEQSARFWELFVDELPIDESCLFRDAELWAWLASSALPGMVERALATGRRLQAVSLGCAGGQEAFSLAMVLLELFKSRGMPASAVPRYAGIRGVDASAGRIAAARRGVLNTWSVERAKNAPWLAGLVTPEPSEPGLHRVDASVTSLTSFEAGNVLALQPGSLAGADLVLCRHVLIYFREERALEVLTGIAAALDPGALLVVSSVEAHLLERLDNVERQGLVGAARVRGGVAAPLRVSPPRPLPPPPRRPAPPRADLHAAAAHLQAGRLHEALTAARAVSYSQPENIMARLFIGQALLGLEPVQGRRVLEGLKAELARLDDRKTFDSELSVGQLKEAVGLLLESRSGR